MCDGHSDELVDISDKVIGVDHCIAPLIKALNDGGYRTLASCCGHGEQPATIALIDRIGRERWLILTRDRAEGEHMMWSDNVAAVHDTALLPDRLRSYLNDPDTLADDIDAQIHLHSGDDGSNDEYCDWVADLTGQIMKLLGFPVLSPPVSPDTSTPSQETLDDPATLHCIRTKPLMEDDDSWPSDTPSPTGQGIHISICGLGPNHPGECRP